VGPRFCVGAALARAEAAEAIEQLLESMSDIVPDRDAARPRFIGHMPRSHEPLNVVLTHRTAART
jgi:cytochrome P450